MSIESLPPFEIAAAPSPWSELQILPSRDGRNIVRAYVRRLAAIDVARPAALRALRQAYETALAGAIPKAAVACWDFLAECLQGRTPEVPDGASGAELLEVAYSDPSVPPALLAAMAQRFGWDDRRLQNRVDEARAWLDDMKEFAQRPDAYGTAARTLLGDGSELQDGKEAEALSRLVIGGRRYAPFVPDAIDPDRFARLCARYRPATDNTHCVPLLNKYLDRTFSKPSGGKTAEDARWALDVAAMYSLLHHSGVDSLAPGGRSDATRSVVMLRDYWEIDAPTRSERHDQVEDTIGWLVTEGHRIQSRYVDPGDDAGTRDLLAWDLARAAMIARHAFLAGYLGEDEAWRHLVGIAKKVQANFGSWQEYGYCYARGYLRWSGERDALMDRIEDFLIYDHRSPWKQIAWETPLAEVPPKRELAYPPDPFAAPVRSARQKGAYAAVAAAIFVASVVRMLMALKHH